MIKIVIMNTNICRIYDYKKKPPALNMINEISHPENKLKNLELVSDKPGHTQIGTASRTSYEARMEPKEIAIDNYAREIARELNQERNQNNLTEVVIIAPPKMLGYLTQHLNKHVKELISHTIHKDIVNLPQHELLAFIVESLKPKLQ